jgi:predicted  nucleic acid-binding Zn-ribbon protein
MNQAFNLFRLQQIDTQIDQTENSLSKIEKLLSGDEAVNLAKQAVEAAEKAIQKASQSLKEAEFAVHEQQIKIAHSEASLYGGRITNPKELQDIQKEIVSLKKHLSVLEDRQLETMLTLEEAENQDQTARVQLAEAQASFSERAAGWLGQKEQLVRNLERLHAEHNAAVTLISKESLQTYENLRKRKSGVAVTAIIDGSCDVCGTTIRPSELQAARAAQVLVFCTSCGRILYSG